MRQKEKKNMTPTGKKPLQTKAPKSTWQWPHRDNGAVPQHSSWKQKQSSFLLFLLQCQQQLSQEGNNLFVFASFWCKCFVEHEIGVFWGVFFQPGEAIESVRYWFSTNSSSMTGIKPQQPMFLHFQIFPLSFWLPKAFYGLLTAMFPRLCSTVPCFRLFHHFISLLYPYSRCKGYFSN